MRALMLALIVATVLPGLAPVATTQLNPGLPAGLDLNGTWVLEERGELLSKQRAVVKITHLSSGLVQADFLAGAECFNGVARPYAFIGQLSFKTPGEAALSAPTMFVCSGSSSAVKRCMGSIPAIYPSNFKDVIVKPDLDTGRPAEITGERFAQGYDDCTPNSKYDGTHPFTLRRVACPLEARKVSEREQQLRDAMAAILDSRTVFAIAVTAAQQRYGEEFNGQPISWLQFPFDMINEGAATDVTSMETFVGRLPEILAGPYWEGARDMAAAMGLQVANPLPELQAMLEHMYKIEDALLPRAQQAVADLQIARAEQAKCLQ